MHSPYPMNTIPKQNCSKMRAVENTQKQASEANIELSVDIEEKLPLATIDLEKIDFLNFWKIFDGNVMKFQIEQISFQG